MSRAFTKEDDSVDALPDRPVSPHDNLVTGRGLALIDEELDRLARDYALAQKAGDRSQISNLSRDLRYWQQRRASAQRVPELESADTVRFGTRVTLLREDGRRHQWRIVGEDEADPAAGTISHVSPVARMLLGKGVGDVIEIAGAEAEIIAIG